MLRALLTLIIFVGSSGFAAENDAVAPESRYSYGTPNREGIGKHYMGREISHVMGHRGARWLERSGRMKEERTDLLLQGLPVKAGDTVVDLGAGSGYFTLPIAAMLDTGKVLAVDIQQEMLDIINARAQAAGADNVVPILATPTDPSIPPGSADLVLLVDAYHEFSHPYEVMQGVHKGLRKGGLVVLVEYRAEDPSVPIKRLHKMTEAQAKQEMAAAGFEFLENRRDLPQQHILVFRKPG